MSQTDWREVDDIFQAAREMSDAAARTAWLDARCAGRPDLHAEVTSLLASYDLSDGFLLRWATDMPPGPQAPPIPSRARSSAPIA